VHPASDTAFNATISRIPMDIDEADIGGMPPPSSRAAACTNYRHESGGIPAYMFERSPSERVRTSHHRQMEMTREGAHHKSELAILGTALREEEVPHHVAEAMVKKPVGPACFQQDSSRWTSASGGAATRISPRDTERMSIRGSSSPLGEGE
jgi:hypothetical protein